MPRDQTAKVRLAAVADLHCREDQHGRFRQLVKQVNDEAEVLVLCGDLTDHGKLAEGKTLAEELSALRVPVAAVLGNHDHESGHADEVIAELSKVGVHCLDGDQFIFDKVLGIAGVKGFCGGFGNATLQAFGEGPIKQFVGEAVSESLKLEAALSQLDTPRKVVIMHYAPIPETCTGENL
ncbi:MAG TPA: metallophosphoesterase, partial [Myxococcaceae bacterium]|nr:metallophosphoesterase [Myxococcaceae bacterium]